MEQEQNRFVGEADDVKPLGGHVRTEDKSSEEDKKAREQADKVTGGKE